MKKNLLFFLLFIGVVSVEAQINLNAGLKAYYQFSGNADDASGNNLNGTIQGGVQSTTDRFGNANSAYHFNGTDSRIIVNDAGVLSTPAFSICYYFNTEVTRQQVCVGKIEYSTGFGATYNSVLYHPVNATPFFSVIDPTTSCTEKVLSTYVFAAVSPNAIQTNQWYCIVNTFENGVQKLFVDGVLVSQQNLSFTQAKACNNTNFLIGSWWQGDLNFFQGKIDDVRFYDRAISQQEVNSLCNQTTSLSCGNWLNTPDVGATASFGDLDVAGNQITVEATINRTQPYVLFGTDNTEGDVVSKHNSPADANYLLRPNHASITTTDGFFLTPDICQIEINKTYHIAMVYDGSTLKFYRDGYLMSQVNATGNLFQNNWNTRIGLYDPAFWKTQFVGFINEVRIWNTAKTQVQLKAYMNSPLPNPTSQPGLLADYTFDNLINKQGNTAFNGTLGGSASLNQTNPNCAFVADSCSVLSTSGGIINDYTPVLELNPCKNLITVEDAAAFKAGDTVLVIQMKGAVIDSSNTAAFGTITDYKNAGNYEFNYVKSKTGNIIELKDSLTRAYDILLVKVQLIMVPYYNTANITATLTCLPWDGSKGGVLVLNAKDSVNLYANIDITGKGFRGGNSPNTGSQVLYCNENNYIYPKGSLTAAAKGEGIAIIGDNIAWGKGAPANGGGSGIVIITTGKPNS